ncbi:MAG TPA: WecB/TagA/CpsF family glycosyltransferase [Terriglobales bacterium]|nr:WecB/TagA/CpsF family glycosyltransferase [Terriglobales bacterium]
MDSAVSELCRRLDSRIKTHVVFVNAAKVVQYRDNFALRDVIERAGMLLADGMPLVWLSRLKGTPLPERVAGVDLMDRMVKAAAERGYRVYFLGARHEVVSKAVADFVKRYPLLQVAGYRDGYFLPQQEKEINAEINCSKADLVLIAMSTPQKELWADRNMEKLHAIIYQGVGGGFDVVAGLAKRAPLWMQRTGLEWSYRLFQEPGRMWKRYLFSNLSFLRLALHDLATASRNVQEPAAHASSD